MTSNRTNHQIYGSLCQTPFGYIKALCDADGLRQLSWQQQPFTDSHTENDVSRETILQLRSYLTGDLQVFSLPLSPAAATPALHLWLKAISCVPYGETVSYAGLAALWGNPKAARAAGTACQKNPIPIIIPCHRIIGSDGSYDKYSGGDITGPTSKANISRKKTLLDLEAGLFRFNKTELLT